MARLSLSQTGVNIMNIKQFCKSHEAEYIEFCTAIVNEYNSKHIDPLYVSDVLWKSYSMELFYANYLVMA